MGFIGRVWKVFLLIGKVYDVVCLLLICMNFYIMFGDFINVKIFYGVFEYVVVKDEV